MPLKVFGIGISPPIISTYRHNGKNFLISEKTIQLRARIGRSEFILMIRGLWKKAIISFGAQCDILYGKYRVKTRAGSYKWFLDESKSVLEFGGNRCVWWEPRATLQSKNVEEVLKSKTVELERAKGKIEERSAQYKEISAGGGGGD